MSSLFAVRLPVNSRLRVVKFWENQKFYADFDCLAFGAPDPRVFKGQPHFDDRGGEAGLKGKKV